MGDFRIVIDMVGNHGHDRENKTGKDINFGTNTPEAIIKEALEKIKNLNQASIQSAVVYHWPIDNYGGPLKNGRTTQIVDCLVENKRAGNF